MAPADVALPIMGLLTGLSLGALGSGGSILALPAFVFAANVPVKSAVATSLGVVGATCLFGAATTWRRCRSGERHEMQVDPGVAVSFSIGSLGGAFTGARLAVLLSPRAQMLLAALVMLGAAYAMLRRLNHSASQREEAVSGDDVARGSRFIPLIGAAVGVLTGVVGVGGGFLIVPALTLLAGIPMKRAAATSLWVIGANAAAGVAGYVGKVPFAWQEAGIFLAFSVAGVAAGMQVARRAPTSRLQYAFSLLLVGVSLYTAMKTLRA